MERRVGVRIEGDASGYKTATEQAEAATKKFEDAQKMAEMGMRKSTQTLGQYQQAMRQLPMQITDVTTSLASGMPVWLVAIQQGGQIRDSFGGVGNALRGFLSLVSPTTLGLGAIAGVGGVLAFAAKAAYDETSELNRQVALLGPTADRSATQLQAFADGLADSAGLATGRVREMTSEMVKVAGVGVPALEEGARAALALQTLTGDEAEKVAKSLAAAGKNVVEFAARTNESWGYLTAEQFKNVIALKEQGREAEATRLVLGKLADTMEQRVANSMTGLGRQIQEHNKFWSDLWATVKGFVSDETIEQRLEKITKQLRDVDEGRNRFGTIYSAVQPLREEAADLRNLMGRDAARRVDARLGATAEQSDIERLRKEYEERLKKAGRRPGAQKAPPISNQLILDANDARVAAYDFEALYPRANVSEVLRNSSADSAFRRAEAGGYEETDRAMREAQAKRDADARKEAQEWMEYRLKLEQDLLQKSQPVWEQMVASWGDMNQRMKDSFDNTVIGVIERGEEAWVRFAQTGKFNVASLVDFIIAQAARQGYREFISAGVRFLSDYAASGNNPDYSNEGRNYPAPKGGESAGVGMKGAMAAGGGEGGLQVTIVNQTGNAVQGSAKRTAGGGIEVLLTAAESFIADRVNNGEGPVVAAMGSRFGLRSSFSSA